MKIATGFCGVLERRKMMNKCIALVIMINFGLSPSAAINYSSSIYRGTRVEYLPGFQGPLPFHLETGYVGVGEGEDVQLFYYFIESESKPKEDSLLLWITGGPGCSSISALFYEFGPLQFEGLDFSSNGNLPTLTLRPHSWTKVANIIYVDLPVGTGFSYARTNDASHSTDLQLCHHAYEFMRKWLVNHPEFISSPLYIGGDSYSGIPVPIITQLISNGNEAGIEPNINLKGYVLGNPTTFASEYNYKIRFANGLGLISDKHYESLVRSCGEEYRLEYIDPKNLECVQNLQYYEECINGIETSHVLEPSCGGPLISPIQFPIERRHHSGLKCRVEGYKLVYYWADDASVREALHIHKGSVEKWIRCNHNLSFTPTIDDVRSYHSDLSNKGYRSLVYSGDHDMIIPHQSTQVWIRYLNYYIIDQWRSWKVDGQIAGYTETYSNRMTFATVKGGGHTAPEYKPRECFAMFKRWISHEQL